MSVTCPIGQVPGPDGLRAAHYTESSDTVLLVVSRCGARNGSVDLGGRRWCRLAPLRRPGITKETGRALVFWRWRNISCCLPFDFVNIILERT
jgi:hypothetical protein